MKRVCFFTYNLFDLGGIQRVVTVLASALCSEYEVYIQCYDEPEKENRALYDLDSRVKVIFAKRDNRKSVIRKALRKLNQKYAVLEKLRNDALFEFAYILPEEQRLYENRKSQYCANESCFRGLTLKFAPDKMLLTTDRKRKVRQERFALMPTS